MKFASNCVRKKEHTHLTAHPFPESLLQVPVPVSQQAAAPGDIYFAGSTVNFTSAVHGPGMPPRMSLPHV